MNSIKIKEYEKDLGNKTREQLVEIVISAYICIGKMSSDISNMKEKHMSEQIEQLSKTHKIRKYWSQKERPLRREDFDNNKVIARYVSGESAYKIAKDLDVGQMTIISRLKRANVYEGKKHKGGSVK